MSVWSPNHEGTPHHKTAAGNQAEVLPAGSPPSSCRLQEGLPRTPGADAAKLQCHHEEVQGSTASAEHKGVPGEPFVVLRGSVCLHAHTPPRYHCTQFLP